MFQTLAAPLVWRGETAHGASGLDLSILTPIALAFILGDECTALPGAGGERSRRRANSRSSLGMWRGEEGVDSSWAMIAAMMLWIEQVGEARLALRFLILGSSSR